MHVGRLNPLKERIQCTLKDLDAANISENERIKYSLIGRNSTTSRVSLWNSYGEGRGRTIFEGTCRRCFQKRACRLHCGKVGSSSCPCKTTLPIFKVSYHDSVRWTEHRRSRGDQSVHRSQARTDCCSAQSSRLSTSLVSRVNEYNNVLPNLMSIAKSWTPCSQSKERSRITLPA